MKQSAVTMCPTCLAALQEWRKMGSISQLQVREWEEVMSEMVLFDRYEIPKGTCRQLAADIRVSFTMGMADLEGLLLERDMEIEDLKDKLEKYEPKVANNMTILPAISAGTCSSCGAKEDVNELAMRKFQKYYEELRIAVDGSAPSDSDSGSMDNRTDEKVHLDVLQQVRINRFLIEFLYVQCEELREKLGMNTDLGAILPGFSRTNSKG